MRNRHTTLFSPSPVAGIGSDVLCSGEINSMRGALVLSVMMKILKNNCPQQTKYAIVETVQVLKVGRGALDLELLHAAMTQASANNVNMAAALVTEIQQVLATSLSSLRQQTGSPLATAPIQDVLMRGI